DLVDLLMDLGKSAVPSEVDVSVRANGEPCKLLGHYDPLRRAFANLLRNAAEAMGGRGSIEIAVSRDGAGLAVTIVDHGAGIPDDLRQRVFEPYFTTKHDGTGDRKSTRLNSSHVAISYAVFSLKKKKDSSK